MTATPPTKTEATELMDAILAAAGDFLRQLPAADSDELRAPPTAAVADREAERSSQSASLTTDQAPAAKAPN